MWFSVGIVSEIISHRGRLVVLESNGRPKRYFDAVARGVGPAILRQTNQRAILTVIYIDPGCSNADIARRTGLAPQTVSAVLVGLDKAGMLTRGESRRGGGRGQPATPLFLNPRGAYAIGVEIGWSRLQVVLTNFAGEVVRKDGSAYAYPDASSIFDDLAAALNKLTAGLSAEERSRVVGLGLAAPSGIGDPASLLAPPPGQAELWSKVDLVAEVARVSGLEVRFANDGSAACWAEFVALPSPRPGNFAYLMVDTFLAAGIIAEDRLWEGVGGSSANLGSMLVTDRTGAPRFAHQVASIHALRQRLSAAGLAFETAIGESSPEAEQAIVAEWIEDAALALAQTILNARTVLEFEFAIVDSVLPAHILVRLIAALKLKIVEVPSLGRTTPDIRQGRLGESGAAEGAAYLSMYQKFFSRELEHMSL